jgi:signal transduction histidine kinase
MPAQPQTKNDLGNVDQVGQLEVLQHFIEMGRFSASMLHEISNPLSAAMLYLEQVPGQGTLHIRRARRSLRLAHNYIEVARRQLRSGSQQQSAFCVAPQIDQLKRLVMPLARKEGISIEISDIPHYRIYGDPIKLQQVLANLLINAIDAYKHNTDGLAKPVRLSVRGFAKTLMITVTDWGEGIAAHDLPKIFKPFYTTKEQAGFGIGLTIVEQYVTRDLHGSIEVQSSSRRGTRFTIHLPALPYPPSHFRKKLIR